MKKNLIAITAAVMLSTSGAWASFKTGNELLAECESGTESEVLVCLGYLQGVVDTYQAMESFSDESRICIPDLATVEQLRKVVIEYFNRHPKQLHFSAGELTFVALWDAFPCLLQVD